jgi:hypothetical protein
MPFKPLRKLFSSPKMPALYRDDPLASEDHSLLPKSEKHVSFNPDLEYHEIESIRNEHKKRVTRRLHIFGLLSIFFGLLFYSHAWRVSVSIGSFISYLTSLSIPTTTNII